MTNLENREKFEKSFFNFKKTTIRLTKFFQGLHVNFILRKLVV